jgi:hypothetical protein
VRARHGALVDAHWIVAAHDRPKAAEGAASVTRDPEGRVHATYGAPHGALYLVRPDGYVGFRAPASAAGQVAGHLDRVLVP